MKKLILLTLSAFLLTSCFTKKHKFSSMTISDLIANEGGHSYSALNFCLIDEIGYSTYNVDIIIITLDGKTFDGQVNLYGGNDISKKCFEFRTTDFLTNLRFSKPEEYEKVAQVYKGNIKSITLKIHEEKSDEILDSIEVTSF